MILREYICRAHGDFDSAEPVCPRGCTGDGMIERVFRTPPTIQTQGYRNINRTAANLAADFGLSDINQRGGDGGRRMDAAAHARQARAMEMLGHGERAGMDMGQFFKPVSAMGSGPVPGALARDPQTGQLVATDGSGSVVSRFGSVKPILDAPAFDGRNLGVPDGDA